MNKVATFGSLVFMGNMLYAILPRRYVYEQLERAMKARLHRCASTLPSDMSTLVQEAYG